MKNSGQGKIALILPADPRASDYGLTSCWTHHRSF